MALRGTDPESYITEYTLVYEDNTPAAQLIFARVGARLIRQRCRFNSHVRKLRPDCANTFLPRGLQRFLRPTCVIACTGVPRS